MKYYDVVAVKIMCVVLFEKKYHAIFTATVYNSTVCAFIEMHWT